MAARLSEPDEILATHVEIYAMTKMATHSADGHCSDTENVPNVRTCMILLKLEGDHDIHIGDVVTDEFRGMDLDSIIDPPFNIPSGSGYCVPSDCWEDVKQHDWKHEVVAAVGLRLDRDDEEAGAITNVFHAGSGTRIGTQVCHSITNNF